MFPVKMVEANKSSTNANANSNNNNNNNNYNKRSLSTTSISSSTVYINSNSNINIDKNQRQGSGGSGRRIVTNVPSFRRKKSGQSDNQTYNDTDTNFDYDIDCDYSHKDMISTTDASSVNFDVSVIDLRTNRQNGPRLDDYYDRDDDDDDAKYVGDNNNNDDDETYDDGGNRLKNDEGVAGAPSTLAGATTTGGSGGTNNNKKNGKISLNELIKCIGNEQRMLQNSSLEMLPDVERRVRDFRLAQQKRKQKYGVTKRYGIFGMYSHLHNIRTDLEWVEDAAYRRIRCQPYLNWNDYDTAKIQTRTRPYFIYTIILLCTIMLLVEFALNDWKLAPLNVNPMIGPSPEALIRAGARHTTLIIENKQWYRIVSPLILHAGIVHYLINMIAFALIGIPVEYSHGFINTLLLFIVPGIGGNILSAIFLPTYISVGASGGIFGLLGACIADIGMNWKLLFIKTNIDENDKQVFRRNFWCVFGLIAEMLINILLGLVTPFIDNWTHLGGLVYGMCCAFTLLPNAFDSIGFFNVTAGTCGKVRMYTIRFLGLFITLLLIMASTIWLATSDIGEKPPCSFCRYVSCIPFPPFQEKKWRYCDDCDMITGEIYMNANQSYYERVDILCPNTNIIVPIDVSSEQYTDTSTITRNLPSYCRSQCI